jgi:hypothetical protein
MSGIYYMVIDGDGNELTTGVSEYEIARVAQAHADRLGETVDVASSDGKEEYQVEPSPYVDPDEEAAARADHEYDQAKDDRITGDG